MHRLCLIIFAFLFSTRAMIMPISKSDGSLDMTSLLSHISLLEQKIDNKASVSVTTKLESQLQTALHDLIVTQTKLDTALEELKDFSNVKTDLAVLQSQIQTGISQCTCGTSGNSDTQPAKDLSRLQADVSLIKSDVIRLSSDVSIIKSDVNKLQTITNETDVKSLSSDVSTLKSEVNQVGSLLNQTNVTRLSSDIFTIKTEITQLQSLHNRTAKPQGPLQGSSVYTRWGRTSCPTGNNMVYKGYAAGSNSYMKGGSASVLCLLEHPIYSHDTYSLNINAHSQIWGTVYLSENYPDWPFRRLLGQDMPCVVCESNRATSIMVPARNACYQGWTLEYSGFLMGGEKDYMPVDYTCVDTDAESFQERHFGNDMTIMTPVVSKCLPLVCPPYVDGKAVNCVVCSK